MFWWILAAIIASVSCGSPRVPEFNCSGIEGLAWWACKSYGECQGGFHRQTDCPDGMAFDQQFSCVDVNSAPFPCNLDKTPECENIGAMITSIAEQDALGPDPPCSFFYTCNNGRFVGHQKCPSGLVFYEDKQICSDPVSVPPPCGSGSGNGNIGGRNLNANNNYGGNNGGYGGNNGGYGGSGGNNGGYGGTNGGYGGSGGTNGGYGGSGGTNGGYGGNTNGYSRQNSGTGGTGSGYGGKNNGNSGGYGTNGGYGNNGNTGGNTGGWGGGYTESYPRKNNYNYNY